jgi:DNA-binding IclR family transcriptional regulator
MKQEKSQSSDHDYSIRAVQRALSVLDSFLEARAPLSLEQVCDRTALPKATVFRIIKNLINAQYLSETNSGYWLGLKILRLGALAEDELDLKELSIPLITELRDRLNETTHLAVLDDDLQVVYLEKIPTRHEIGLLRTRVGHTRPMHCTGLGKAIAAHLPEERIRQWLRTNGLKRYTDRTIVDVEAFLEELRLIRARGYAVDTGEHNASIRCIAAPIRDRAGDVIAAVSVAGPDSRMPVPLIDSSQSSQVVETANRISEMLGNVDLLKRKTGADYERVVRHFACH